MTLFKNDKVVLIKYYQGKLIVGETYEIGNITETSIIIRDRVSKVALAAIDVDAFPKYFMKPVSVQLNRTWTPWEPAIGADGTTYGFYRTNNKKVQFKSMDGVRGEASCHADDEFSLKKGISLAQLRATDKAFTQKETELDSNLKMLRDAHESIRHAISSLSGKHNKKVSAK